MRVIDVNKDTPPVQGPLLKNGWLIVLGATEEEAIALRAPHKLAMRFGPDDIIYGNDAVKAKFPCVDDNLRIKIVGTIVADLNENILLTRETNGIYGVQTSLVNDPNITPLQVSKYAQNTFMKIGEHAYPEHPTKYANSMTSMAHWNGIIVSMNMFIYVRLLPNVRLAIGNVTRFIITTFNALGRFNTTTYTPYCVALARLHLENQVLFNKQTERLIKCKIYHKEMLEKRRERQSRR